MDVIMADLDGGQLGVGQSVQRRAIPRRFVAWLGIVALWLTVAMPTVSRLLPPAWTPPALGAWCTGHGLVNVHPQAPSAPPLSIDRCGYCGLLGHSPLLPGATMVALPSIGPPRSMPTTRLASAAPSARWLGANPRGPPRQA